jgi:putative ABC transport system permease protein
MAGKRWTRRVFKRYTPDEDVERELQTHLDLCVEELVQAGWDREAARGEAEERFGDSTRIARECGVISKKHRKAVRRGYMIENTIQDLRYALRGLIKNPGFTLVAIVTLALGIGANATVFSLVNGVLLEPLPYENPEELVWIAEADRGGGENWIAWPNYRDWREQSRTLQAIAAFNSSNSNVLGGSEPAYTRVSGVSQDFWRVFPMAPTAGRLTGEEDHKEGGAPVAILNEGFATEILGGDAALGQMIEIGDTRYEVVGIVPEPFHFPSHTQVWIPEELEAQNQTRSSHNHRVVARLQAGLTPLEAFSELDPMTRRIVAPAIAAEGPEYHATGVAVRSLREELVGSTGSYLYLLLGAAGFVLLVACTNLASTLLARGTTRAAEMAVRSAVGASKGRIVRQLVLEAFLLATLGSAAGLALAYGSLRVVQTTGSLSLPRLGNVAIDGPVLLFTLGATVVTALAFGLFPALRSGADNQAHVLRTEGRGQGGRTARVWGALVATEVALAMVLLTGSGLLIRSFSTLLAEDGGFDETDVAVASVAASQIKYPEREDHRVFWDDLLRSARTVPGVATAGVMSRIPAGGGGGNGRVHLNGDPSQYGNADYVVVSEGALEALDATLLQGRLFQESDGPNAPHVVVVSRSFADKYWPDESPIGKLMSAGGMDSYWDADPIVFGTIVGVISDIRFRDLTRPGRPTAFWNYRQRPSRIVSGAYLVAEASTASPAAIFGGLRTAISTADPDVPIRIRDLNDMVAGSLAARRFTLLTMGAFAFIALFLATLGIHGVVSYAVAKRTREMGVRLALGATGGSVQRMVMKGALVPVFAGLLVGMASAWALSRLMAGLLYQISPSDPTTFLGVASLLLTTAIVACAIPAHRGTRVDPMIAMRGD